MVTMISIWQYNKIIDFQIFLCTLYKIHIHTLIHIQIFRILNSKQMVKFLKCKICTYSYPTGRQYFYFISIHKTNINSILLNPIEFSIFIYVYVKHSCDVRNMLHFHWQLSKASRVFFFLSLWIEWASKLLFDGWISFWFHEKPLHTLEKYSTCLTHTHIFTAHFNNLIIYILRETDDGSGKENNINLRESYLCMVHCSRFIEFEKNGSHFFTVAL